MRTPTPDDVFKDLEREYADPNAARSVAITGLGYFFAERGSPGTREAVNNLTNLLYMCGDGTALAIKNELDSFIDTRGPEDEILAEKNFCEDVRFYSFDAYVFGQSPPPVPEVLEEAKSYAKRAVLPEIFKRDFEDVFANLYALLRVDLTLTAH